MNGYKTPLLWKIADHKENCIFYESMQWNELLVGWPWPHTRYNKLALASQKRAKKKVTGMVDNYFFPTWYKLSSKKEKQKQVQSQEYSKELCL
jgi:hypothetical protein